ncbi:IclR family transcriptional regulator [Mycobacterium sp. BK558]|uniref:Glycerol operon regulatory protein n=1 Tax=Mycolicibacterium chlorophenolicum TaxID=37916 RepID=A0A0J6W3I4_9MYCO|nr:IclR family transcriptional regulator [Mycolicibacterium chlorophenolicum]KMO76979.1 Acetate operon repressor [Mycolicibacterium chlorophenolicum]MBI5339853.1 IclR family transcriptional regulator [Mycolicibacterium rufum]RZT18281.1 IclR family transcriptional regulator [Mycobacterium sp. BK558]
MTEDIPVRKVKSAVRTVELLEYLAARHDDPARLREISDALEMPRSSAHALLRTLVSQGWVRSDPSGTLYGIGIRALLVGTSYLDSDPYLPLIVPFLEDLRAALDETFHLGRLDGTDIVYLATRESKQYTRTASRVGRRLPAYATSLGKSLLAERFGVDRDRHVPSALTPLTATTITDRGALDRELDEVRLRGYACDDEENTVGLRCFAVPLRYCRPAQDAISASVPVDRLDPQREREIVDALRAMGDKVSRVVRPLANGDKWFAS